METVVEPVALVVDRGKEPHGDGTHPVERLLDLLVWHEVQPRLRLLYNTWKVRNHVEPQKKLLVNIRM
jgi:hypothetical protein